MSLQPKPAITSAKQAQAIELDLRPLEQDPKLQLNANGEAYWRAYTCDAAFTAELPQSQTFAPGWYAVSVTLVPHDGHVAGPRLYIPNEDGVLSEARSVELKQSGADYVAKFYLPCSTQDFRFDPSIYPCKFSCGPLQLTPIAGSSQWWATLSRLFRFRLPSTRLFAQWCRTGMRLLGSHGVRALARAIYDTWLTQTDENRSTYTDWIAAYAQPDDAQQQAMREAFPKFTRQPVISLITPVYNTPEKYLRAAIDSVLGQIYTHWELCLADDASTAPHVKRVLEEYRLRDARIKVVFRQQNGHISAASNSALELATGEFVALLDHDDTLTPDALFWVAKELNDFPATALIYSDEDKLDPEGVPTTPYFKCDWNYDLFLSHNLITHLGVYRTDLVKNLGGFRPNFDGAQDYDLALRFIEQIDPSQIRHIPRVLYHWRMLPGSTAIGAEQKDYAAECARLAIEEHLARQHIAASVETIADMAVQRVRYKLPASLPLVSIIIPTRNGKKLVQQCVDSIRQKTTYGSYEILLVDNGSDEKESLDYFAALSERGQVRLIKDPSPFNFSRINNDAVKLASGDYLVFLNNDIEVISPDWLSELVSHARRPGIGAVGARLWYPNDTIQHAGLILVAGLAGHAHLGRMRGDHGYFSRASLIQSYSAVTGACLCIRKQLFEEAGGFDETLAVAFNDVDFCLRLHAKGYRNLYTPYAELYHHESATRGYEDTPEKMIRFKNEAQILQERWMPMLVNDPCYNPNLTLTGEPFTLAWPPRIRPFEIAAGRPPKS
jgi:GT2 family glycosyltransferase